MAKSIKNIGASVRARLQSVAREHGEPFDLLMTRFANERLLYRISISPHADRFVLKGAMLLLTLFEDPHRATRDVDLLGFGDPDPETLREVFQEILSVDAGDGLVFDAPGLRVDRIREEIEYGGIRLRTTATLDRARINITVDIGFGDSLEPGDERIEYPSILDFPPARIRAYSIETVIAEKFQAMVVLGMANSRMKDFYDVWVLMRTFTYSDDRLAQAICATFARRETVLPNALPVALSPEFSGDPQKQIQWKAFVENVAVEVDNFDDVVASLGKFLMHHGDMARSIQG